MKDNPIPRAVILEIYRKFDQLAHIPAEVALSGNTTDGINRIDSLCDEIEVLFAGILTPEERGEEDGGVN